MTDSMEAHEQSSQKHRPFLAAGALATCGGLVGLALAVVLFTAIGVFTNFLGPDATRDSERRSNYEERDYTFDPETLLASLDRGETGLFSLQAATPPAPGQPLGPTYAWTQADFFRAARAVWQQGWGESFDGQELYMVRFSVPCGGVPHGGFNTLNFASFKAIESAEGSSRLNAGIWIDLGLGQVGTYRAEYTPDKKPYSPIDVEAYPVSAESALRIAEASGGAGMRAIYRDDCEVSVTTSYVQHPSWWVNYVHHQDHWWDTLLTVEVDPYTGEATVTDPED